MKKKHLRAMALAMAALMSLTACGGGSSTSSEAGSTTAGAADTTAADTTAAAVADPNATYKETTYRSFPAGSVSGSSQKQYSDRTSDVRWNRV